MFLSSLFVQRASASLQSSRRAAWKWTRAMNCSCNFRSWLFFVSVISHSGTNCDASRGFIPCDVWFIKRPLHYSRVCWVKDNGPWISLWVDMSSERQWTLEFSLGGIGMLNTDQLLDNLKGRRNGLAPDKNDENWVAFSPFLQVVSGWLNR